MKNFIMLVVLLILSLGVQAQVTVTKDKDGNYTAKSRPASSDSTKTDTGKPTGKTYTDSKGVKYPVLLSPTGKLYVMRTSAKTGNKYKQYLKEE
jgi:hypothetical protein